MMPIQDANFYLENLLETIPWKNDEAVIFGKLIIKKGRLCMRYFSYTYSKRTKQALIWTPRLLALNPSEKKNWRNLQFLSA
jgi:hypothetical protein